jgi:hypothetical protein
MWVRIIDQSGTPTVAEVVVFDPTTTFTHEIAALFQPQEPGMVYRAEFRDGQWVAPPEPDPAPEPIENMQPAFRTELTPPEFKLQFTSAERIAMRAARAYAGTDETKLATQAVIDDWFDIIDDPRLTTVDLKHESTQQGVAFLVASGILTQARADEVLAGVPA